MSPSKDKQSPEQMTTFIKERLQKLAGILKKADTNKETDTNGDMAIGIFVMKSPFTPKGWEYDHIME